MVGSVAATGNVEKRKRRLVRTTKQQRDWTQEGLRTTLPVFPEAKFSKCKDFTTHETFKLFFDVDIHLTGYGWLPKAAGRPSLSKQSSSGTRLSKSIRFDSRDQFVVQNEGNKRRLCASDLCVLVCPAAPRGLCLPCFQLSH